MHPNEINGRLREKNVWILPKGETLGDNVKNGEEDLKSNERVYI